MLLVTRYWLGLMVTGYFLALVLGLWVGLRLCFMITGYWSGLLVKVRFSVRCYC